MLAGNQADEGSERLSRRGKGLAHPRGEVLGAYGELGAAGAGEGRGARRRRAQLRRPCPVGRSLTSPAWLVLCRVPGGSCVGSVLPAPLAGYGPAVISAPPVDRCPSAYLRQPQTQPAPSNRHGGSGAAYPVNGAGQRFDSFHTVMLAFFSASSSVPTSPPPISPRHSAW